MSGQPGCRHSVDSTRVLTITSTPTNATPGYAEDETIRVRLDFAEAVSVTGTPYLVLDIAGVARRATYASGSGTRYLNFEYTVQTGDFDSNGISLCSSRSSTRVAVESRSTADASPRSPMVLLPNSTCLPWATSRITRSTVCRQIR